MPSICTVSGTIYNLDGSIAVGVPVKATVVSAATTQSGQLFGGSGITSTAIEAVTDATGTFSLDLVQGAKVLLEIPGINLKKTIDVPPTSTADFSSLI